MNQRLYQSNNYGLNGPVSFSYPQTSPPGPIKQIIHNPNLYPNINSNIHYQQNVNGNPTNKSASQIVYKTQTLPTFLSSVPFHNSQIHEPVIHKNTQLTHNFQPINHLNPLPIRPNVYNRNLSDFRRSVSPINTPVKIITPNIYPNSTTKELQKYQSLRWQNKYEDLKTKYFELLSIVQNNSQVEDSWLLEEQNKLLRQKVKLLEEKDHKYYNEVTKRIQKMIDFHKQTTTQECSLLIDRFRLENKFLQKI